MHQLAWCVQFSFKSHCKALCVWFGFLYVSSLQCMHGISTCVSLFLVCVHVQRVCCPVCWATHTRRHTHTRTQSDVTEQTQTDWNGHLCKHVIKSDYRFKTYSQRHICPYSTYVQKQTIIRTKAALDLN